MHELPVTEGLLKLALEYGQKADAARITDLHLVIGDLSSIVDDSVQFYWDIISKGTIAEGATLHFERVRTRMYCFACAEEYIPQSGTLTCPTCGSAQVKVAGGDEFRLESIEVEREDQVPASSTNGTS